MSNVPKHSWWSGGISDTSTMRFAWRHLSPSATHSCVTVKAEDSSLDASTRLSVKVNRVVPRDANVRPMLLRCCDRLKFSRVALPGCCRLKKRTMEHATMPSSHSSKHVRSERGCKAGIRGTLRNWGILCCGGLLPVLCPA